MKILVQIVVYKNEINEIRKSLLALSNSQLTKSANLLIRIGDNSGDIRYSQKLKKLVNEFSTTLKINYVENSLNRGHGQTHNELFFKDHTDLDFLLIMNPDGFISPNAISLMMEDMKDQAVGVVEARQLPLEHPKSFNLITGETSWVAGACLLIRADVFRELDGFDPRFFLHGDDIDLSWRIRNLGYTLRYEPRAIYVHAKDIEVNGFPKQSESERFYGPLGALLIAHKYNLRKGLKLMLDDLRISPDPIHADILREFEQVTQYFSPVKIKSDIPVYVHPWKFSVTRY
jgi:GT2 family glycosyltransferase